jgi:L-cystine uptake protein TcyP (sodium:dicarboxylate symporter family)
METSRSSHAAAPVAAGARVRTVSPPPASADEAAAIIAALGQFRCDTAPPPAAAEFPRPTAWKRAGLVEGVARRPDLPL